MFGSVCVWFVGLGLLECTACLFGQLKWGVEAVKRVNLPVHHHPPHTHTHTHTHTHILHHHHRRRRQQQRCPHSAARMRCCRNGSTEMVFQWDTQVVFRSVWSGMFELHNKPTPNINEREHVRTDRVGKSPQERPVCCHFCARYSVYMTS